ncbi:DNA-directed RNA polymerase III subunit [Lachnellula occidentalis]|uniref:DNA-directed RNA polymerase III subunit RPC9 n=1 Tax=Lachnellula occidentalis TaxID=215460 RepID=A0A8H8UAC3_9HELO|nr:DNA-directed RNA polymerase III subunit [Lachnellula occidentalis]
MKILEAQSATLTNYEVYTHLVDQGNRYSDIRKYAEKDKTGKIPENVVRRPGNLWTLRKELLEYFREAPSPLACQPIPYNDETIRTLLKELRRWEITKGEVIMMLNLRPTTLENLNTIFQEMETRFGEEDQTEILDVITRVLGTPDGEAERQAMADVTEVLKQQAEDLKAQGGQQPQEQV